NHRGSAQGQHGGAGDRGGDGGGDGGGHSHKEGLEGGVPRVNRRERGTVVPPVVAPRKYTETIRMPLRNALLEKIAGSTIGGRPLRLWRRSQAHQAPSTSSPAGKDLHISKFTSRCRNGSMISRRVIDSSTVPQGWK